MKKYGIILAVCLVVGTFGSLFALGKAKKMERTPAGIVSEEGNPAAAEGLEIVYYDYLLHKYDEGFDRVETTLIDRMRENTIRFEADGIHTDTKMAAYDKTAKREEEEWFRRNELVETEVFFAGIAVEAMNVKNIVPDEMTEELKKSGETVQIPLSEITEYYPITFHVGVPTLASSYGRDTWSTLNFCVDYEYSDREVNAKNLRIAGAIRDAFRIPVIPEEVWELQYEKESDDYGEYYNFYQSSVGKDSYTPSFVNAVSDSAIYFTYDTHTKNGAIVDTSKVTVPGGYGIYILPYIIDENIPAQCDAKTDELRLLYPLDPEMEVKELYLSQDQKTLLVLYQLEGEYCAKVIDVTTAECVFETQFGKEPESVRRLWTIVSSGEDWFAINLLYMFEYTEEESTAERLARSKQMSPVVVIGKNDAGQYGKLLDTNGEFCTLGGNARNLNLLFDGKRLAIVFHDIGYTEYITVQIFTGEGLVYSATLNNPSGSLTGDTLYSEDSLETVSWGLESSWKK